MESETYYRIVDSKVAHEIIDGEAIIIHFDTGNYYSLNGISSRMWEWFEARASRTQIHEAFKPMTIDQAKGLDAFIENLVQEGILEKTSSGADSPATLPRHEIPFELPTLSKYNDMQVLLLSDPIHDVDETGWPNLEADSA